MPSDTHAHTHVRSLPRALALTHIHSASAVGRQSPRIWVVVDVAGMVAIEVVMAGAGAVSLGVKETGTVPAAIC